jgi:D-sedoheptulose 7-phosphate isomerase
MKETCERHVAAYTDELAGIIAGLKPQMSAVFPAMAQVFRAARDAGRTIFVMGNGGSAAEASHLANDVNKYTIAPGKRRYKCIALTDALPLLTAWANDAGYEDVFVEQLRNFMEPGDVLLGISGSGNSKNCLLALEHAKRTGCTTITWTGYGGGKMVDHADVRIVIPSHSMVHCEDAHVIVHHCFVSYLRSLDDETSGGGVTPS